jgi:hypothetical protein
MASKARKKMAVVKKKVEDLIPYVNNARTHSDEQVTMIAASIKEFGFNNPILLDGENGVIAGHGRLMAAKKIGLDEVPCIELKHLTEAQKKAYILADNRLAENAGWDEDLLKIELNSLKELNFDIESIGFTGFDDTNFEEIETVEGENDPEEEWTDMPEYNSEDVCYAKCIVSFETAKDREDFFHLLGQEFTDKTLSMWFPKKEKRELEPYRWAEDDEEQE